VSSILEIVKYRHLKAGEKITQEMSTDRKEIIMVKSLLEIRERALEIVIKNYALKKLTKNSALIFCH
jgi:hypothetical protein